MKLLSKVTPANKDVNTSEPLGHGFDAAVVVVVFFFAGFGLDKLLDTTPLFMIVMTLIGAVGVFVRFWYRYDARMTEHEAERAARSAAGPKRNGS
jgi:F0F1-type ATP synthase assembly protein I